MENGVEVINVRRIWAEEIINAQGGKFFTVIFSSKVDGREVKINGRLGVKKFLKNLKKKTVTGQDDLKVAFNVKKMEYRKVFLDGVKEIRGGNKIYTF